MVNIPFLGSSDEDKENNFSNIAGQANLDRSQPGESDQEIADMHKSRSKQAFEQDDKFSGSNSEWRKATEVEKENDFGEQDTDSQETQRGLNEDDLGLDSQGDSDQFQSQGQASTQEDFQNQEGPESHDTPDFSNAEAETGSLIERENESPDRDIENSGDELSDSLEENIRSIKGEIDDVEEQNNTESPVERESSEDEEDFEDESIEDAVDRFEEIAEKFDFDAEDLGLEIDEDELEDIQDNIQDLDGRLSEIESSQLDLAEEADNRLEEVEQKVESLESRIETDSGEDGVKVEGIDTVERLEDLEEEIADIKDKISNSENKEASVSANEEIHRKALDNEVKELRKDVKELSEAVVTISQKVFQE